MGTRRNRIVRGDGDDPAGMQRRTSMPRTRKASPPEPPGDFGTMGLALFGPTERDTAAGAIRAGKYPENLWKDAGLAADATEVKPLKEKLCGARLARNVARCGPTGDRDFCRRLALSTSFARISWARSAAPMARSSPTPADVAEYVAKNFDAPGARRRGFGTIPGTIRRLPRWLLDRTMCNTSVLATTTCYRFANGRFYGYEGIGCCRGTCGHVYYYAQAVARLFPDLERSVREMVDFGIGFHPDSGLIEFRGDYGNGYAADAQAGYVLRAYREHQVSANDAFLRRVWPRAKRRWSSSFPKTATATAFWRAPNTTRWTSSVFGPSSWLSSLYIAALCAGEAMAREMGDEAFAAKTPVDCRDRQQETRRPAL